MKTSQYRQNSKTRLSPLVIGFIASCMFHLSLFAMLIHTNTEQITIKASDSISINLSNIVSPNIGNQVETKPEMHKKEVKKHKKHKKIKKVEPVAQTPDDIQISDEVAESQDTPDEISEESEGVGEHTEEQTASNAGGGGSQGYLSEDNALYMLIKNAIDKHNIYPKVAIRRKIEGNVIVEFIIYKNGGVSGIKVLRGNHNILNQSAIEAVKKASTEFPNMDNNTRVKIVIVYNLQKF